MTIIGRLEPDLLSYNRVMIGRSMFRGAANGVVEWWKSGQR